MRTHGYECVILDLIIYSIINKHYYYVLFYQVRYNIIKIYRSIFYNRLEGGLENLREYKSRGDRNCMLALLQYYLYDIIFLLSYHSIVVATHLCRYFLRFLLILIFLFLYFYLKNFLFFTIFFIIFLS